jgi:uncharacterized protein YlaN (UPF0358 family)
MTTEEVRALRNREFCMHELGRSREDINKLTDEQVDELTTALCNVWEYMLKQEYAKSDS